MAGGASGRGQGQARVQLISKLASAAQRGCRPPCPAPRRLLRHRRTARTWLLLSLARTLFIPLFLAVARAPALVIFVCTVALGVTNG